MPSNSRRNFLRVASLGAAGSWIALSSGALLTACRESQEARQSGARFKVLRTDEAAEFAAIAARIIPTDDQPGATEAGVIYFMDNVLGGVSSAELQPMRDGLTELQQAVASRHSQEKFSALPVAEQDALLHEIEDGEFFQTMRYLTLAGTFSHPSHGGNRNKVGWQLLGYEDRHGWQPPFGAYDADYNGYEVDD
jgi:gluconate 2-dehydrogenase gamma chain